MSKEQAWFHAADWQEGLSMKAHASIDLNQFYSHYHSHPERWKAVFEFLKKDLTSLDEGKYPVMGDDVFAMVSNYSTKNPKDAKWEAHRKYIDLQYVIDGEETMGLLDLSRAVSPEKYDEANDLIFFGQQEGEYFRANPMCYFVFFPSDVHRPCMMMDHEGAKPVKKLVFKIAVD
ncbi:YhcH/YjgK/YiaL family protein [uncultured Sunxiuqinia sp.]|uniref:YhcH/YjgK/YiaL family protein n=1 Tax=uncultured Sunxiuqinia sp. TaxID=1573825 RepID=UPI00262126D7|nr:YhcH/YjgK/YiaL family protein [uncultured Sunxiuqinia sp.]